MNTQLLEPTTINKEKEIVDLIRSTKGKIFSATFIKRTNGEVREMICRLGVKSYLKGGVLNYDPSKKKLIVVFDMIKCDYRMINIETVIQLVIDNKTYKFD